VLQNLLLQFREIGAAGEGSKLAFWGRHGVEKAEVGTRGDAYVVPRLVLLGALRRGVLTLGRTDNDARRTDCTFLIQKRPRPLRQSA
jgi:hypothetical protein